MNDTCPLRPSTSTERLPLSMRIGTDGGSFMAQGASTPPVSSRVPAPFNNSPSSAYAFAGLAG